MKLDAYKLVSECVDQDTFTIDTLEGPKDVPVIKRPVSQLDVSTGKDAVGISKEYTAKAKPDPDPKKMKSDDEKGSAAGNA